MHGEQSASRPFPHGARQGLPRGSGQERRPAPLPMGEGHAEPTAWTDPQGTDPQGTTLRCAGPPAPPRSQHHCWCLALTPETQGTSWSVNAAMPRSRVIN